MANTKLKTVGPIIAMEQQASVYAATALLTASFTLPANVGGIWCYPSAACHYNVNGAATASVVHAVAANEPFYIEPRYVTKVQIFGDAGAITLTVAYMRGSRPAKAHAVARPY